MSREAEYLSKRGWVREGASSHGFVRVVIWHKDGISDGCQQWEAIRIEREKGKVGQ